MKMAAQVVAGVLIWMVFGAVPGWGQTQPPQGNGFKPYGSYEGSSLDSISMEDANFLLHAPVIPNSPQRGDFTPQYMMYISSKNWGHQCDYSSAGGYSNCFWNYGGTGVVFEFSAQMSVHRQIQVTYDINFGTEYSATGYSLTTFDGASHSLVDLSAGNQTSFETVDGTGYRIVTRDPDSRGLPATAVVIDGQGTQYWTAFTGSHCSRPPVQLPTSVGGHALIYDSYFLGPGTCEERFTIQKVVDHNGNQITGFSTAGLPAQDTLGRAAWPVISNSSSTDSSGCVNTLPFSNATLMSYPGANGGTNTLKVCLG
ncbi:MAG TPA: hypothetical protein VNW97_16600, partial [Candidatus Saccharimonadales bacterium]|nr:hypothetical protein [Candidatus Saccharimonadales bacterium]